MRHRAGTSMLGRPDFWPSGYCSRKSFPAIAAPCNNGISAIACWPGCPARPRPAYTSDDFRLRLSWRRAAGLSRPQVQEDERGTSSSGCTPCTWFHPDPKKPICAGRLSLSTIIHHSCCRNCQQLGYGVTNKWYSSDIHGTLVSSSVKEGAHG